MTALADELRLTPKVQVGDIRLRDFLELLETPNGVYSLFDQRIDGKPLYVGKASARSFIGRIPVHFEPREDHWLNQFAKAHAKALKSAYMDALEDALNQYVVFVGFPDKMLADDKHRIRSIGALESALQWELDSPYNSRRGPRRYSGTLTVEKIFEAVRRTE